MTRARALFLLSVTLTACPAEDEPDADIQNPEIDAAVQPEPEIDAAVPEIDAPVATPDAASTLPDAAPQDTPDAAGTVTVLGDLGFRPATHGFRFPNYGNRNNPSNLSPAEVRRFFGDQVCADLDGDTCVLTPPAEEWMNIRNDKMGGGHCEGFAVLSLLLYKGVLNASSFGGASTHDLNLASNVALMREIAYWWAGQLLTPTVQGRTRTFTPNDVVDRLVQAFNDGSDTYTIGIWKRGWEGGHAVTPFAVVDHGGGVVRIMVYDNNWPDMERFIEVDRNANTWTYFASTNPNNPTSKYEGDATTKTMFLVPTAPRLMQQVCPFCTATGAKPQAGGAFREIALEGDGDLLITDDQQRRLGYVAGAVVNEIPSAAFQPVASEDEFWADDEEPVYRIPGESPLTISLDGSFLTQASLSSVSLLAPGVVLGVEDVMLDPGQQDEIYVSGDSTQIRYATTRTETPEIFLGVEQPSADYAFFIQAAGESGGQSVDLDIDRAGGKLRIDIGAYDGAAGYDIIVVRIDSDGAAFFTHSGAAELAGDLVYLDFGSWTANGSPMTLELDKGGDGTIDEVYTITDEG